MSSSPLKLCISLGRESEPLSGAPGVRLLFVHLVKDLAGAWSEIRGDVEHILFGWPSQSREPWFQVLATPSKPHNVFSLALERMIFARGIGEVGLLDEVLAGTVRCGMAAHPQVPLLIRPRGMSVEEFLARNLTGQGVADRQ